MKVMVHPSLVGPLTLVSDGSGLVACFFEGPHADAALRDGEQGADPVLDLARRQLDAFFARRLQVFSLPLAAQGTAFQQKVWAALRQIPFGATTSYGALAQKIGAPKAMRAVGAANGRNPISIIVPCHRVIGADGSLTGFGGGLPRKKTLLSFERGEMALL